MSQWKVVFLVVLALAVGTGFGYVRWGSTVSNLREEAGTSREAIEKLQRQLDARDAGADAGSQRWEAHGVVRAVYPQLLLITHEQIPGLLPAKTSGFRLARGIHAEMGDAIRFWVHGQAAHNSVLVALEEW